ncbi:MAG: biopolymer transporter ExbD [Candidatus Latescibacterota bacterium]
MRFARKSKVGNVIPTCSMADISFLLIIFFMVSTVFIRYRGIPVSLPAAERIEKLESRRNVSGIWINAAGSINIDDQPVALDQVGRTVHAKLTANPRLVISVRADENANFGLVSDLLQELRKVEALRVNFSTRRQTVGGAP